MARKYMFLVLFMIGSVYCETSGNSTEQHVQDTSLRKSREIRSYIGLVTCAMNYDVSCFVNAAEDYLEVQRTTLLAEADEQALHSTGRSDPDSKPSHLAHTITQLVGQLTNMFRNGLSGFFSYGREAVDENDEDDEDDSEVDENELADTTTGDSNGEARGKKKKKKKFQSLLKLLAVGYIIYLKVCLILKLFHKALLFKFFLLALGAFALHAIKFWLSFKKDGHPTKVIYYEHAQHQHHYGHGEDEGHSIWGRSFDNVDNRTAADLAYSTQRPYYVVDLIR